MRPKPRTSKCVLEAKDVLENSTSAENAEHLQKLSWRSVEHSAVSTARLKVAGVLKTARPPKRNIDKEEEQALKELKKAKDIMILKADKGNCTVIMDRPDYDQKINALLNDNDIYSKLVTK